MNANVGGSILLVRIVVFFLFGVGAFICAMNFYLSFLRFRVYRLRGSKGEYRHISGAPFLGSILVVVLLLPLELPMWARIAALALAALDTGGFHWFIGVVVWQAMKKPGATGDRS